MFTLSKSDAIVQVLPTALRFWTKLGLGPRGGKKNVTAFALFEDDGEEKQHLVEHWLDRMSATYSVRALVITHYPKLIGDYRLSNSAHTRLGNVTVCRGKVLCPSNLEPSANRWVSTLVVWQGLSDVFIHG